MTASTVELRLLGQKIALKSNEDPQFVREVVDLVSSRIREAEKRMPSAASHHVALLALLDLAEEYVRAKQRAGEHQKQMQDKSSQLLRLIEAEFK